MKKTGFAFVLLAAILMNYEGAHAQKLAPKSAPVTIAPDLTKLNIEKMLQQLQTTNVQPSAQDTSPLQGRGRSANSGQWGEEQGK